jgi:PPOX class probable F420-dependent enzyme
MSTVKGANDLSSAKYISFTTTRRNGTTVSTPVWVVGFGDGYAFTTEPEAGKVKRVRNNPAVTIAVCDVRGRVREGTPVFHATAAVATGETATAVNDAIRSKYRVAYLLAIAPGMLMRRLRGKPVAHGAITFTLNP